MKTNKNKNCKRPGWDTFVQLPTSQTRLGTSPVPFPSPTADDPANLNMTSDSSSPSLTALMNSASELAVWLWLRVERNLGPQRPCGSRGTCHGRGDGMTEGWGGPGGSGAPDIDQTKERESPIQKWELGKFLNSACGCSGLTTDLDEEEDVEEEGKVDKSISRVRAIDYECMWIQVTMAEPGDSILGFLVLMRLLRFQVRL